MNTGQQPTTNSPSDVPASVAKRVPAMERLLSSDPSFLSNVTPNDYPRAWYHFSTVNELQRGPIVKEILGKRLVGFLTDSGQPGVLDNRCIHMGSDLGAGCVIGDSIQCSLHHWQFAPDGRCTKIPVSATIPRFARQTSYPATTRQGNVYFFNGPVADHPLPFFDGVSPTDLVAAKPFVEFIDCPWYMIGANAVDMQHFAIAHDRKLRTDPIVDYPHPLLHRTECHLDVVGDSVTDTITKRFGGAEVRLNVADWCSTMVFAHSRLKRTETFGMVAVIPISPIRTMAHITVMARSSEGAIKHRMLDPLRAAIRRFLIRDFLRSDIHRLKGTQFSPHTLVDIDQQFLEYFHWLAGVIRRPIDAAD